MNNQETNHVIIMEFNIVGKVVTKIGDKLFVVGDFGQVECINNQYYDWEYHHVWKERIDK